MKVERLLNGTDSISITGVGLAVSLGLDAQTVWSRVRAGECGARPMTAMESPLPPGKDGGQAPELPVDFLANQPREVRYLRWTIESALRDADVGDACAPARRAILLGTTLHGMRAGGRFLRSNEYGELKTFLAGDTMHLATRGLGIEGLSATTCSACSSSLGAVALAVTLLERGDYDLIIAGGYDTISEYVWAGFNALRLISDPPLRPFTRGRCGMKVAEGYGIVTLERRADADRRGARTLATVAGWGESADAFHLTRPEPEGRGALEAMRQAVRRAGIEPNQLDLVAAHATGTPDNDSSEAAAIRSLCGEHRPPVVGFKSHLGHTLGGAGAVELILSALAIRDGVLPPSANVVAGEVEYAGIEVTSGVERRSTIKYTLNTSLGFGGANTCVVLSCPLSPVAGKEGRSKGAEAGSHESLPTRGSSSAQPAATTPSPRPSNLVTWERERDVLITGIGVLMPGAIGNDALLDHVRAGTVADRCTIDDVEFEHLVENARRMRRMSSYVKLSLCAATLACRDAGVLDPPALLAHAGAILGTTHGSAGYSYDYYSQIVRDGVGAANPVLFAEGVPNAAAAQLSLMLGMRGACQTIIGTETAGLDALRLAAARIESGAADRIIVCAAEESHVTLDNAYAACFPHLPREMFRSTSCAAAFLLESRAAANARSALRAYATIVNGTSSSGCDPPRTDTPDSPVPIRTPGSCYSVAPLLPFAALLLDRPADGTPIDLRVVDRNEFATSLHLVASGATLAPVGNH